MATAAAEKDRRILFTLIAWALPLLILATLEGALRLAGFGDNYDLFVPLEQNPDYLQPNPEVIKRFFSNPDHAPDVSIDTSYFLAEKPENALRIVVQGGSSAAGFPYGKNASPAGMLQQRLARSFPTRTVEVILTAMSAVNSYTLLDFAGEIVEIQPDAVVIYAGHNEFLGVLGVGSSLGSRSSPGFTRLFLSMRELRLFRLMQRVVGVFTPDRKKREGTLMANIAADRSIALDSATFQQGVMQFRSNLDALLAHYRAADIPVFVGTLASNEKDQAPFSGSPEVVNPAWDTIVESAQSALQRHEYDQVARDTAGLVADFPDMALAHYLQGRAALALGNYTAAKSAFSAARDHDRLRFRAPGVFEEVIRQAAAEHGADVVEVEQAFEAASPNGIIGNELMLEHLHPNADGYFILSSAYFDELQADGLGLDWKNAVPGHLARAEQPISRVELLQGKYRVDALMHDWPFVAEKKTWNLPDANDREAEIAQTWYAGKIDWIHAMNQALVHYQQTNNYTEASRVAVNLADAFPFEAQPQHVAGMMLVRQTPPQGLRAIPYFHRAVRLDPDSLLFMTTLARAYYINGFSDAARQVAQRLLQMSPDNEIGQQILEALDN
ncbi:MAG: tetratricopeptide repeat protein [Gammaproteobacteria bacterium]|nr:tetratricopeptide repeat protein [Gammaproteobacteria bacterium]MDH3767878.1 tetratricopeptide repeat protein [Gammaproteobacteria bacterium]